MFHNNSIDYFRSWMDKPHLDTSTNEITMEFAQGLREFMSTATNQERTQLTQKMFCPCALCCNNWFISISTVWRHLYARGFMAGYKIWYIHGETEAILPIGDNSNSRDAGGDVTVNVSQPIRNTMVNMLEDRFGEPSEYINNENNISARYLSMAMEAAMKPLYTGCRKDMTGLAAATTLMGIKTDYNLSEECVDRICKWGYDLCPEDNTMFETYDQLQKLVAG